MRRLARGAGCLLVAAALAAGGCATGKRGAGGAPDRSLARNILIGVAIGTAALAVGAALGGAAAEKDLRDDLEGGGLGGREFTRRDAEGLRWNRLARAALFASGLSFVGLGILWEMGQGDRHQGDSRQSTVDSSQPRSPRPQTSTAVPPRPDCRLPGLSAPKPSTVDCGLSTAQLSAAAR